MMEAKKTIQFADALCEDARGNLTKMNRIGANKAFQFYQNNVVMLGTVSREQFVACYPDYLEEIEGVRLAVEKSEEAAAEHVDQGDRIAVLESKLDKMAEAIERLLEAKTEEPEEDDPPKRKRGRSKKETETEEEAPPADAEAEAEEDK